MQRDAVTRAAIGARAGDEAAAADFVRATQADLWRLHAHLVSRDEARDLTQETYLRAFRALAAYRGEATARTWLFAIARRVAVDHLRARGRRPAIAASIDQAVGLAASASGTPGGRTSLVRGDVAESVVLRELVASLVPDRRVAFVLTQLLGLSYAEVAEICDCPIGTIRSRVARARDDLIAALAPPSG